MCGSTLLVVDDGYEGDMVNAVFAFKIIFVIHFNLAPAPLSVSLEPSSILSYFCPWYSAYNNRARLYKD